LLCFVPSGISTIEEGTLRGKSLIQEQKTTISMQTLHRNAPATVKKVFTKFWEIKISSEIKRNSESKIISTPFKRHFAGTHFEIRFFRQRIIFWETSTINKTSLKWIRLDYNKGNTRMGMVICQKGKKGLVFLEITLQMFIFQKVHNWKNATYFPKKSSLNYTEPIAKRLKSWLSFFNFAKSCKSYSQIYFLVKSWKLDRVF